MEQRIHENQDSLSFNDSQFFKPSSEVVNRISKKRLREDPDNNNSKQFLFKCPCSLVINDPN